MAFEAKPRIKYDEKVKVTSTKDCYTFKFYKDGYVSTIWIPKACYKELKKQYAKNASK